MDYRKYCDLESYLFGEVNKRFQDNHWLDAFDFFCIIIWKANRSKSKIAAKLKKAHTDLELGAKALTYGIAQQATHKDRMRFLWEATFDLPMASAILTVLYPEDFTVYDVRVCNMLGKFHNLKSRQNFDVLWDGYQEYKRAVEAAAPKELSLRDKDRYLWGKSFYEQLKSDISSGFIKDKSETDTDD